jgi:tRNA 2-thiouridine synthesizing protein E
MKNTRFTTDEHGFLVDPEDWSEEFARQVAGDENITLTEHHWAVVQIIRELYAQTSTVPELRTTMKKLKETLGSDYATRKFIYQLFPYGYGQQACKIAGMRLPRKLWLDV